jgi:hypothetical protein
MEGSLLNSNLMGSSIFGKKMSGIKSVQRGLISMDVTTENETITEVDLDKSIIIFTSYTDGTSDGDAGNQRIKAVFSSSTQITFTRHNNDLDANISWEVIEFDGAVKVQSGIISIEPDPPDSPAHVLDTITEVDLSKSFLIVSGLLGHASDKTHFMTIRAYLTNSTTVRITVVFAYTPAYEWDISWFVVEFP